MRIGELARLAGTTPKAIRLYEALGLLGAVARVGSYRQYGESDLDRVRLIRQAQALGFRLSELDGLHAMHTHEGWARIAALVAGRRTSVARELQRLRALDHRLADLEAELHACDAVRAPVTPRACGIPLDPSKQGLVASA